MDLNGTGNLYKKYIAPPFSALDGKSSWWLRRKKAWGEVGINSAAGRREGMIFSPSRTCAVYPKRVEMEKELGRPVEWHEFYGMYPQLISNGTSVFDPVLVELLVNWFCPEGGRVLDPFAGGSVRGIVSSAIRREYHGVDLSLDQINENIRQYNDSGLTHDYPPTWIHGDSVEIDKHVIGPFDMVFSCPPYHDLEVYSDNPADISAMGYDDFISAYREIIRKSVNLMADDAFACFVVGEIRDKGGKYRNFVGDTVTAFVDAGADFYNEIIYLTPFGNLPIRVAMMMDKSRKIGKTHQNILIFCKGDPVKATAKIGAVFNYFGDADRPEELDDLFA